MARDPLRAPLQPARGRALASLGLSALGVVYGDIGTSPLYALRGCFQGEHAVAATTFNVLGVLSLIFWALTIIISLKYLSYVLRADNRGEGGILALMALATRQKLRGKTRVVVLVLGVFGAALLYGDGMITPAISVLGAVEGLRVAAPQLESYVVPITLAILLGLFLLQRRGTARVGALFGPITLLWFIALAVLGGWHISRNSGVLAAINPAYGVAFVAENGSMGFLVLGAVFLVVTGGEALYADMGHFGARPIRLMWFVLVLPALLLNYFGQGALLIANPSATDNPFYRLPPSWALYPMLLLATLATVIASQAVISGAFSLTRQAIMLGYWPRVRILHTSSQQIGQIYVPSINWLLLLATMGLVLGFGSSSKLAAAYGIAVTTTMVMTTLLAYVVARRLWAWGRPAAVLLTLVFLGIDLAFFAANVVKIEHGGWFAVLVAASVFLLMTTWHKGRAVLGERIRSELVPLEDFFELMRVEPIKRVPGTAVFMTSNPEGTPPALMHNFTHNRVVHEQVILLTIVIEEVPFVREERRVSLEQLPEGFVRVIARYGFTEQPDVVELLARNDTPSPPLEHTTFFLGLETLLAEGRYGMSRWRERLFALMTRNAQRATRFFNVPPDRVVELGAQIEL